MSKALGIALLLLAIVAVMLLLRRRRGRGGDPATVGSVEPVVAAREADAGIAKARSATRKALDNLDEPNARERMLRLQQLARGYLVAAYGVAASATQAELAEILKRDRPADEWAELQSLLDAIEAARRGGPSESAALEQRLRSFVQ